MGIQLEATACPVCGGDLRGEVSLGMDFGGDVLPEEVWGNGFVDRTWTGRGGLLIQCADDGRSFHFFLCSNRCAEKFPKLYEQYVKACNASGIERELVPLFPTHGSEAPNWLKKIRDHAEDLKGQGHVQRGKVTVVDVYHDNTCPALRGGTCNCDADINLTTR